jgi:uncharacterized protein
MKAFVESLVRSLTDHPEAVRVSGIEGEKLTILELRCHRDDLGRVIGKSGATIGAIRTLAGVRADVRAARPCWRSWSRAAAGRGGEHGVGAIGH